jgi:Exostosin family/Methyltransferase domain
MPKLETQDDFDTLYLLTTARLFKYKERYKHIRKVSDQAYLELQDQKEKFDFVFIDGLHTYEQCKIDLENYNKLIKQGGVVAGHDIDHPSFPLLTKAIEEFASKHNAVVVRKALHSWYIDKTWNDNEKTEIVFNENDYLRMYPDVARAVARGKFRTGYDHYLRYGRKEGRKFSLEGKLAEYIDNVNPNWSNHLTLNGYVEKPRILNELSIVEVPEEFQQVQNIEYPKGNKIPFERYFNQIFLEERPGTLRKYLPIHWTSYYVNNKYGHDKEAIKKLQDFIDTLPKRDKFFTVVQYDDGILNDISGLDILVYSMGCNKPGYYPIPLLSQPLNSSPYDPDHLKYIEYSFIGQNTHSIRERLVKELGESEFIKLEDIGPEKYRMILQHSKFAICPRGYGITSFRMFEAMSYGCVPLYVSDEFWEPFNIPFENYGIKIRPEEIKDIPKILKTIDVPKMQKKVEEYFKKYFVYSSCFENIIKTLQ